MVPLHGEAGGAAGCAPVYVEYFLGYTMCSELHNGQGSAELLHDAVMHAGRHYS